MRSPRAALFVLWLAIVFWLSMNHAYWRDEVRGLSFATSGATVGDMFAAVRGDGHPLLWYLLLRAGDFAIGSAALPVVAIAVAAAGAALLIWRAPFSLPVICLLVLSRSMLWDFSVMARNYGISMLLLFGFAALYRSRRNRGVWLGILLCLLANTNVHSLVFAWLLLGFWMVDVRRLLLVPLALLTAGTMLCLGTVFPTFNDAALATGGRSAASIACAFFLPGFGFLAKYPAGAIAKILVSCVLYGSLVPLLRRRALAFAAGLLALMAMSVLFTAIYPGSERHIALWLAFLVTLYWLAADAPRAPGAATRIGRVATGLLVASQVAMAGIVIAEDVTRPQSRSRNLGAFIRAHPELMGDVIVADPDYLVEALPYYVPNPVYRMREGQFGPLIHFTEAARVDLDLRDVIAIARSVRDASGRDVLILLHAALDPRAAPSAIREGYNWTLRIDPQGVQQFLDATTFLVSFAPANTDESFSVYRLRRR